MSKPRFTPSMQWVSNAAGQMGSEAQRILRALIDIAWNRTGEETSAVVTGTAGTNGNIAKWNADGDLVDGGKSAANLLDSPEISDAVFRVVDNGDQSKKLGWELSGLTAPRTWTAPDASGTVMLTSDVTTGTWTPGLDFGGAHAGMTGTFTGTYRTVNGVLVFLSGSVALTAKGSSAGAVTITGAPFTPASTGGAVVSFYSGMSLTAGPPLILADSNPAGFRLYQPGTASATALSEGNFTNTTNLRFSVIFHT